MKKTKRSEKRTKSLEEEYEELVLTLKEQSDTPVPTTLKQPYQKKVVKTVTTYAAYDEPI